MEDEKMKYLLELFMKFQAAIRTEKGQTLVEYGLVLLLIALVVIVMVKGIGGTTTNTYSKINATLT